MLEKNKPVPVESGSATSLQQQRIQKYIGTSAIVLLFVTKPTTLLHLDGHPPRQIAHGLAGC